MNIYSTNDYRTVIETVVAERKLLDSSVTFQELAISVRVPKSYLSRVVHGKADLNTDQLFLVCQYFDFSEEESAYMRLLLELARTGLKARKDILRREIKQIQDRHLDTKAYIKATQQEVTSDQIAAYYLDPLIQLVHICLSIPRYQSDQNLLADDLRVAPSRLLGAINKLEQLQLVARKGGEIRLVVENMHLPKHSAIYKSWRNQIKLLSINRLDAIAEDSGYSFSVTFSSNEAIKREIQVRFLQYLKEVEALVAGGPQEDAYQMSFEIFPWTKG